MTTFLPGDIVRHQSGLTGTLDLLQYGADWCAHDEHGQPRYWREDHLSLLERPERHPLSDVSIDERVAPIWGWVFLLVAVALLGLAAWAGMHLARLL